MSNSIVNIIVALPCEARSLIDCYALKKVEHSGQISLYKNMDQSIHLAVSGIGQVQSATSLGFLQAYTGNQQHACYLNVGIAGGRDYAVGDIFLVNKVHSSDLQKSWYPVCHLMPKIAQIEVQTYSQPQEFYPDNALVDMEAAGFWQAGIQFVNQEQLQICKILSDNDEESLQQLNAKNVQLMIEAKVSVISEIIDAMRQVSESLGARFQQPNGLTDLLKKFHVTRYQEYQLSELLRRWQVLLPSQDVLSFAQSFTKTNDLMVSIQKYLFNFPPPMGEE